MSRICLVSHNALGAFGDSDSGHIGGVERQTVLLARWLAGRGHDVSVITWADGEQRDWTDPHGVAIFGTCPSDSGIRRLRFVTPRWTSLNAALRRANADVYYHNAAEVETGQVAMWCKRNGRRFVYSVASEPACEAALPTLSGTVEKSLYRYGLRNADVVIAQTSIQASKLLDNFGREAIVLPMPCEAPDAAVRSVPDTSAGMWALWVGRLVPLKRLELLLDAAAEMDEVRFSVIASDGDRPGYAGPLKERATQLDNVDFLGRVALDGVWQHYAEASMLICTSEYEGFPNTFLEAMANGLPIITTFDPDGLVARENLGMVAHDARSIVDAIRHLQRKPGDFERLSANAKAYFLRHHAAEKALPRFEAVLAGATSN